MNTEPAPALRPVATDHPFCGETVALQWEPQRQFVGALLHHSATAAAPLLAAVPATAIDDPLTRWAYEIVRALAAEGRDPHPPAVSHRARTQPAARALRPDRPPTTREHRRLSLHLVNLYTEVICPRAAGDYARDVLEIAYRRMVHALGTRIRHLAETCTDTEVLVARLTAELAQLDPPPPAGPIQRLVPRQ